jgi:hypothetical protein
MKRPSTISQNVLVLVAAAGLAAFAGGCGSGGAAGGMDAGGTGGTGAACDVPKIFSTAGYGCAIPACHSAVNPAGNFDMTAVGWETKLVGKAPPGGGGTPAPDGGVSLTASLCATAGQVYLVAGSAPATGLFMSKLSLKTPPCGARMPNIGGPLTAAELACVQTWANALTKP